MAALREPPGKLNRKVQILGASWGIDFPEGDFKSFVVAHVMRGSLPAPRAITGHAFFFTKDLSGNVFGNFFDGEGGLPVDVTGHEVGHLQQQLESFHPRVNLDNGNPQ